MPGSQELKVIPAQSVYGIVTRQIVTNAIQSLET
jgi:hypothetical protein